MDRRFLGAVTLWYSLCKQIGSEDSDKFPLGTRYWPMVLMVLHVLAALHPIAS